MKHAHLLKLLAVPAVAVLLVGVGCEDDDMADSTVDTTDDTITTPGDTGRAGTPEMTTPPADTGQTAGAQVGGEMDQQIQQITQRIDTLRTRADASPEAAGASERLETLGEAVEAKEWDRVVTTVTELRTMTLPEDLKTELEAIITQLRQLEVPALQNIPESGELPTAPGIPPPGEAGGAGAGGAGDDPDA